MSSNSIFLDWVDDDDVSRVSIGSTFGVFGAVLDLASDFGMNRRHLLPFQ